MLLLHHELVFPALGRGQLAHALAVGAGEAGGAGQENAAGRAAGHHARFGAGEAGDLGTGPVHEFLYDDEGTRCFIHFLEHFGGD